MFKHACIATPSNVLVKNVHALAHLRMNLQEQLPQENLASIVNKELQMLHDILEKLDPQMQRVKSATPLANASL